MGFAANGLHDARAAVLVRAEVTSPSEFALVLDGPRSPAVQEVVVAELACAAGAGDLVRQQLDQSDRCDLPAWRYLSLNEALLAAGRNKLGGPFFWVSLPSWVVGALPEFCGREVVQAMPLTSRLPEGLMPYQSKAVHRALVQGGRVLLADEMGLGKTVQALAVVAHYLDCEGPVLIVTPSSLGGVWRDEARRWLPWLRPSEVQLILSTKERPGPTSRLVIVSYALFARLPDVFGCTARGEAWQIIVCDEAHYLRNPASQRSRALLPLLQGARHALLVTGTPTPKQASDAFALVHALRPLGCTFKEWCDRYGSGRTENREAEVAALLFELMVRRVKADVLDQLPPKHRQRVALSFPPSMASTLKRLRVEAEEGNQAPDEQHFQQLAKVKEAAAQDYTEYLLDASDQKFLLFGHHISMLNALEHTVSKRGVGYIRIDGSTPAAERPALVEEFQSRADRRVAVLSVLAAGEGLTLTAAALCVFCELCPAVPGVIEQAEARVHRIGQRSTVDVHFLVVDGTRDDQVFARLEARGGEVARVMGDGAPLAQDPAMDLQEFCEMAEAADGAAAAPRPAPAGARPQRKRLRRPGLEKVLGAEISRAQGDIAVGSNGGNAVAENIRGRSEQPGPSPLSLATAGSPVTGHGSIAPAVAAGTCDSDSDHAPLVRPPRQAPPPAAKRARGKTAPAGKRPPSAARRTRPPPPSGAPGAGAGAGAREAPPGSSASARRGGGRGGPPSRAQPQRPSAKAKAAPEEEASDDDALLAFFAAAGVCGRPSSASRPARPPWPPSHPDDTEEEEDRILDDASSG